MLSKWGLLVARFRSNIGLKYRNWNFQPQLSSQSLLLASAYKGIIAPPIPANKKGTVNNIWMRIPNGEGIHKPVNEPTIQYPIVSPSE